jgi:hypothetical protein
MARHSSVYSLGAGLRDELLAKWRCGQYTLDQLVERQNLAQRTPALAAHLRSAVSTAPPAAGRSQ